MIPTASENRAKEEKREKKQKKKRKGRSPKGAVKLINATYSRVGL